MIKFENIKSTIKQPAYWSDTKYHYILLSQVTEQHKEPDGTITTWYSFSYNRYTQYEYDEVLTKKAKQDLAESISNELYLVRQRKVAESKELLEKWYELNPMISSVHKATEEFYTVTTAKQTLLSNLIQTADNAKDLLDQDFKCYWNSSGGISEEWDLKDLKKLSIEIYQYIQPKVTKQQEYEQQIKNLKSADEINALKLEY